MAIDIDVMCRVREVIAYETSYEPSEVKPESNLWDDLGLDSLDAVEIELALEEAFGVTFSTTSASEEILECKTVNDVAVLVKRKLDLSGR